MKEGSIKFVYRKSKIQRIYLPLTLIRLGDTVKIGDKYYYVIKDPEHLIVDDDVITRFEASEIKDEEILKDLDSLKRASLALNPKQVEREKVERLL